ncbi:MAG: glycoside hydrolase domain-containing protein, partial [Flavobacterium sp.]
YRKPENFASSLVADPLEPVTSYVIRANETRPLWVTIDVPSDAKAGLYKSFITLNVQGQGVRKFDVVLNVIDKVLPPASDWKFHLDLWQNPYAVARFHNVQPWSQAHWDLLKPLMKTLADAGQKVITVSLNKRPWGGQTFDQYEAMIDWKKNQDGTWSYDFTIFDNWVQFMMDLGIKDQISCYSMVPWGNELYYFDEAENKEVKITAPPGTKQYEDFWIPFLSKFKKHLKEKGWNKITRMAMDERGPDEMKAMFKLLNKFAPELGASFADNHKSYKLYPNELKDMSVAFGHPVDEKDLETRKQNGYISTYYVCCSDLFPNVFTFSPPAEGVFIGWYSIAANFDGFLRWAYNSWVENPLQDSRFKAWPAGDTYIVYPDNRSSIRFETLREGIQDAEKIRILREDFKDKKFAEKLNFLNEIVNKFYVVQKPQDIEGMLEQAKSELNTLAKVGL